jgi:putative transport protein
MTPVREFLVRYPDLAIFLVLGIGFWIGSFKYKGFGLGSVTGSLFAGLLVGQFAHVPVSPVAKSVLFLLFLFGIGYSVGPQIVNAMRGQGLKGVVIGIVVPIVGVLTATAMGRILKLDVGFAAGMYSGGITESPAIGTASEAIRSLGLPEADAERLIAHVAVADSLCYLFGALGVILFCSLVGPRLLGIDVRAEAEKLEAAYGIKRVKAGVVSAWRRFELRCYRVPEGGRMAGRTVAELENLAEGSRIYVPRLRRDGEIIEPTPGTALRAGDVVAVASRREVLVAAAGEGAREVEDRELLEVPVASFDIYVAGDEIVGRPLAELGGSDLVRGVFLRRITRGGLEIPIAPATTIERGDVITVVGPHNMIERIAPRMGAVVRPTDQTDFVALGLAIFFGGVAGALIAVPVAGVKITLSTSVGTLLAGLLVGWLRSVRPTFARIPDAAINAFTSLGLAAFVGMVGLHAGPVFVTAVREAGLAILLGGVVVTLAPMTVALLIGRYVLRMNPLLLLGAIAGAQTMTAGLAALQERSGSPIAVLGYTAAVPFGHILLTTGGTVVVYLMA